MTKSPFAGPFKLLRKELGHRQIPFAKMLGISQSFLSKIERGNLEPDARVFIKAYRLAATSEDAFFRFKYLSEESPL